MPPMGAPPPVGISASPRPAQALRDPWWNVEPVIVLYKAHQICTSPAAPVQLRRALHQPCLLCQLQNLPHKDREGLESSSRLLPAPRLLGWSWEAAGCSTQIVSPTPSSDCSMERGWRGGWHGGEQWESWRVSPVPPSNPLPAPPAAPHPAFPAPGPALGPHPGGGAGPSGRELAGSYIPKMCCRTGHPCIHPMLSVSPHCHQTDLPPVHSRREATPQTWPDAS